MSQDLGVHLKIIQRALTNLHYDSDHIHRFEVVNGGGSGSLVYRLWDATEPLILKVSLAESDTVMRERARREVAFYESLAMHMPIATPQLLASYTHERAGSALLLASYNASEPSPHWNEWQYIEVATQLAQIHSRYWSITDCLSEHRWLQPFVKHNEVSLSDVSTAWQPLLGRLDGIGKSRSQIMNLLAHGVHSLRQLTGHIGSFPTTLCHGDCHIDNLLRDDHTELIWADWQEICIGHGPCDLSFFVQRAMMSGGNVPEVSMLAAYHQQLVVETGETISIQILQQVMNAFELRTRLLHWPAYLTMGSDTQILDHIVRIEYVLACTQAARFGG